MVILCVSVAHTPNAHSYARCLAAVRKVDPKNVQVDDAGERLYAAHMSENCK